MSRYRFLIVSDTPETQGAIRQLLGKTFPDLELCTVEDLSDLTSPGGAGPFDLILAQEGPDPAAQAQKLRAAAPALAGAPVFWLSSPAAGPNPWGDLLFLLGPNSTILNANQAVLDRLGYTTEELSGKRLYELLASPSNQEIHEADPRLWAGPADEFFFPFANKSGETIRTMTRFSEGTWNDSAIHLAASREITDVPLPEISAPEPAPAPESQASHWVSQREQARKGLRRKAEIEKQIAEIYIELTAHGPASLSQKIQSALETISRSIQADRAYIIHFMLGQGLAHNVYEWCAAGIPSQNVQLNGPPAQAITWWTAGLANLETIHISDIDDLPAEAQAEKSLLRAQGIRSMAAAPLVFQDHSVGFLAMEALLAPKPWSEEDLFLLKRASEMFAQVLTAPSARI